MTARAIRSNISHEEPSSNQKYSIVTNDERNKIGCNIGKKGKV